MGLKLALGQVIPREERKEETPVPAGSWGKAVVRRERERERETGNRRYAKIPELTF